MFKFFDKLEDKVRRRLSRRPIWYAMVGGVGVVLFWRGVWHTADYLMLRYVYTNPNASTTDLSEMIWWDGPFSLALGGGLLLVTGAFVSNFIGNEIIISGLKGEKKISEKAEKQIKSEAKILAEVKNEVKKINERLDSIK
jgi:hypothetical protein